VAETIINGSYLGNQLTALLDCDGITPGDAPSYEACKVIYDYHPLGAKLVEAPITIAQSQPREISIAVGAEDRVREAFVDEWEKLGADGHIFNVVSTSRIYGVATIAMLDGTDTATPLDPKTLWKAELAFSVFDPLNTAGSLVLNLNPNAPDFMKTGGSVTVQGQVYHRSRVFIKMNERPIYLAYTTSAYGFVGRSVYQRTLYPLKSFLRTMVADEMVARKAGIIVAKMKQAGSIVNSMMQSLAGGRRQLLKEARTDNVISITPEEDIQSIDLQNVNQALELSRKNILNNIAAGAGMPGILVNEETFAEGFGEGTEDAKHVAQYIGRFRGDLKPVYDFFDAITQYRAWNEEFFDALKRDFPDDYGKKTYEQAFYEWRNAFRPRWPALLEEPDSEKLKADDVKLKGVIAVAEVLMPACDPDNKAVVIEWLCDNVSDMKNVVSSPIVLDYEALAAYEPPVPQMGTAPGEGAEPAPPKPMRDDSASVAALVSLGGRLRKVSR